MKTLSLTIIATTLAFSQTPARPASSTTQAQAPEPSPLDGLLEMIKEKVPDNLILKAVAGQVKSLTPSDVIRLRRAGASDKLLEALMEPGGNAQPASPPQTNPVPQPAPAADESAQPKKRGFLGRVGDRAAGTVRRTGNRTVESAERTAGNTIGSAEQTANNTVDRTSERTEAGAQSKLDSTQQKIDTKVDSTVGGKPQASSPKKQR